MAKYSSHKRRSQSKARTMRMKGGGLAGNPPSSWGWGLGTAGNGWTQFMNALTLQPGQNAGTVQSNNLVPVGNINAQDSQPSIGSNLKGAIPQSGGRRGRRRRGTKRGGNLGALGAVVNQAIVPGTLLAAQQMYGRRRRSGKRRH